MASPRVEKPHARAVVTVTLEIDLGQGWGGDCMIDQVWKQAKREAEDNLRIALDGSRSCRLCMTSTGQGNVRIIGEPSVRTVIVDEGVR